MYDRNIEIWATVRIKSDTNLEVWGHGKVCRSCGGSGEVFATINLDVLGMKCGECGGLGYSREADYVAMSGAPQAPRFHS